MAHRTTDGGAIDPPAERPAPKGAGGPRSVNPLERPNGEIKRRTDAVGIFLVEPRSTLAAITRPVGAILLERSDGGRCSAPAT